MAHLTGPVGYPQQTSEVTSYSSLTPSKIDLGTRARDKSGNEYVYVDFQQALALGEIVAISDTFTAAECSASSLGAIGVVCGDVASSDYAGWVQIYGKNSYTLATSGTSAGVPLMPVATTDGLSMPVIATSGLSVIEGMIITTAPSTATSPSSITGVAAVQLNYPYIIGLDHGVTS